MPVTSGCCTAMPSSPVLHSVRSFLNQIAADVGVGLRFNLTVLILRTDVGFPIIEPNLPAGQHVVIDKIDFGSSKWRGDNLVFNLAIGYPF